LNKIADPVAADLSRDIASLSLMPIPASLDIHCRQIVALKCHFLRSKRCKNGVLKKAEKTNISQLTSIPTTKLISCDTVSLEHCVVSGTKSFKLKQTRHLFKYCKNLCKEKNWKHKFCRKINEIIKNYRILENISVPQFYRLHFPQLFLHYKCIKVIFKLIFNALINRKTN
jgi:hypothetical protein